jgi:hypothetical protein
VSPCWPQDLYKVGEYDSDEGGLWADDEEEEEGEEGGEDGDSQASWTTESEAEVELDDSAVFNYDEEVKKGELACKINIREQFGSQCCRVASLWSGSGSEKEKCLGSGSSVFPSP